VKINAVRGVEPELIGIGEGAQTAGLRGNRYLRTRSVRGREEREAPKKDLSFNFG